MLQGALGIDGGGKGVGRGVKGDTKRIADDLKNVAVMRCHRLLQNFMMPGEERVKGIGKLLGEWGAALNIGKEKRDGAGRAGCANGSNIVTHSHLDKESLLVRTLLL